jgi:hypothetical protein
MLHPMVKVPVIGLLALVLAGSAAPARAQDILRYKFKAGEKLRYGLEQKMKMEMTIQGNQVTIGMDQVIDFGWNIKNVDKDGKATMTQTFERVRMNMNTPQGKVEYDSKDGKLPEGPFGELLGPLLKSMAGLNIGVSMDARGQISNVEIPKEFTDALKNSPAAAGAGDMFSQEGMKRMISQSGLVLPEGAPVKGKNWDTKVEMKMPFGTMKVVNDITYEGPVTREGVKVEQFAVKPKATLEADPNAQISATLKSQDTKGASYFDPVAGRLVETGVTQIMELEIKAMGQVIEQKIEQTVTMKLLGKDKDK